MTFDSPNLILGVGNSSRGEEFPTPNHQPLLPISWLVEEGNGWKNRDGILMWWHDFQWVFKVTLALCWDLQGCSGIWAKMLGKRGVYHRVLLKYHRISSCTSGELLSLPLGIFPVANKSPCCPLPAAGGGWQPKFQKVSKLWARKGVMVISHYSTNPDFTVCLCRGYSIPTGELATLARPFAPLSTPKCSHPIPSWSPTKGHNALWTWNSLHNPHPW